MVLGGRGSERVDGRLRPGKEVRSTLMCEEAMTGDRDIQVIAKVIRDRDIVGVLEVIL